MLDPATSLVAEGKVLVASNGGKPVPPGSLIEPTGELSSDPRTLYGPIEGTHTRDSAKGEGALRAFGEHKGSGLAFMCEILAGCLTGGGTSGPIPAASAAASPTACCLSISLRASLACRRLRPRREGILRTTSRRRVAREMQAAAV